MQQMNAAFRCYSRDIAFSAIEAIKHVRTPSCLSREALTGEHGSPPRYWENIFSTLAPSMGDGLLVYFGRITLIDTRLTSKF